MQFFSSLALTNMVYDHVVVCFQQELCLLYVVSMLLSLYVKVEIIFLQETLEGFLL